MIDRQPSVQSCSPFRCRPSRQGLVHRAVSLLSRPPASPLPSSFFGRETEETFNSDLRLPKITHFFSVTWHHRISDSTPALCYSSKRNVTACRTPQPNSTPLRSPPPHPRLRSLTDENTKRSHFQRQPIPNTTACALRIRTQPPHPGRAAKLGVPPPLRISHSFRTRSPRHCIH